MPIEETGKTRVRTDCLNFDVCLCIQIKKLEFEEEGTVDCFLWDSSLITNVLVQLLKDIINGVCYQRYEKRLEQQKRSSKR